MVVPSIEEVNTVFDLLFHNLQSWKLQVQKVMQIQGKIPGEKAFSCQLSLGSFPLSKDVFRGLCPGRKMTYLRPHILSLIQPVLSHSYIRADKKKRSIFKNYIVSWDNSVIKQTVQPINKKVGKLKKREKFVTTRWQSTVIVW